MYASNEEMCVTGRYFQEIKSDAKHKRSFINNPKIDNVCIYKI